jgi:hypothetical protein
VTIDTLFDANEAGAGGGLYVAPDGDGHDDFAYSCAITSSRVSGGFLNNSATGTGGAAYFAEFDDVWLTVDDCDFGEWARDANSAEGSCSDVYVTNVEEGTGDGVCYLTGEATFVCDSSSCIITEGDTPPL